MITDKIMVAKEFACNAHTATLHAYNGHPYEVHLEHVVYFAEKYLHLVPDYVREDIICACWLHDTIEDCRVTYSDIKEEFGHYVAELVYAVTNEKGRNRKERANDKYYDGIRSTGYATFTKLCDRLANVKYSVENNISGKLGMYRKEHSYFSSQMDHGYTEMKDELSSMLQHGG